MPFAIDILKRENVNGNTRNPEIIIEIILSSALMVSLLSNFMIFLVVFNDDSNYSMVNRNAIMIMLASGNLGTLAAYIMSIYHRKRYVEIYKNLHKIQVTLTSACGYKSLKSIKIMFNVFAISQAVVAFYFFVTRYMLCRKLLNYMLCVCNNTGAYSVGLLTVASTQYIAIMYIIRFEYRKLNGHLSKISQEKNTQTPTLILGYILETLLDMHNQLRSLMQTLNNVYSTVILGGTLRFAIRVTSQLSLLYHISVDDANLQFSLFDTLLPDVSYSIILWMTYYLNESSQQEMNRTTRIIHFLQRRRPDLNHVTEAFVINKVINVKGQQMSVFGIIPMNLGALIAVQIVICHIYLT